MSFFSASLSFFNWCVCSGVAGCFVCVRHGKYIYFFTACLEKMNSFYGYIYQATKVGKMEGTTVNVKPFTVIHGVNHFNAILCFNFLHSNMIKSNLVWIILRLSHIHCQSSVEWNWQEYTHVIYALSTIFFSTGQILCYRLLKRETKWKDNVAIITCKSMNNHWNSTVPFLIDMTWISRWQSKQNAACWTNMNNQNNNKNRKRKFQPKTFWWLLFCSTSFHFLQSKHAHKGKKSTKNNYIGTRFSHTRKYENG